MITKRAHRRRHLPTRVISWFVATTLCGSQMAGASELRLTLGADLERKSGNYPRVEYHLAPGEEVGLRVALASGASPVCIRSIEFDFDGYWLTDGSVELVGVSSEHFDVEYETLQQGDARILRVSLDGTEARAIPSGAVLVEVRGRTTGALHVSNVVVLGSVDLDPTPILCGGAKPTAPVLVVPNALTLVRADITRGLPLDAYYEHARAASPPREPWLLPRDSAVVSAVGRVTGVSGTRYARRGGWGYSVVEMEVEECLVGDCNTGSLRLFTSAALEDDGDRIVPIDFDSWELPLPGDRVIVLAAPLRPDRLGIPERDELPRIEWLRYVGESPEGRGADESPLFVTESVTVTLGSRADIHTSHPEGSNARLDRTLGQQDAVLGDVIQSILEFYGLQRSGGN